MCACQACCQYDVQWNHSITDGSGTSDFVLLHEGVLNLEVKQYSNTLLWDPDEEISHLARFARLFSNTLKWPLHNTCSSSCFVEPQP